VRQSFKQDAHSQPAITGEASKLHKRLLLLALGRLLPVLGTLSALLLVVLVVLVVVCGAWARRRR